jgi:hypothetical protein
MSYYPYLNDKEFLKELDLSKNKEQYIKIIVLDWQENPIKEIQGKAQSGSLNLNGSSAIRRTGNISIVIDEDTVGLTTSNLRSLLSLNKKINLQVGFKNFTNKYTKYPIIWFPLGVYVIGDSSITSSVGNIANAAL